MPVDVAASRLDDARGDWRAAGGLEAWRVRGRVLGRAVRGGGVCWGGGRWLARWLLWWARALCLHVRVPLPVCVGRSVGAVGDAAREGERGVVCCSVLAGLKVPAYSCQLVSRLLSVGG